LAELVAASEVPPPPPSPRPTSEPLLPAIARTLASTSTDTRSLAELVAASEVPSPEDSAAAVARAAARARHRAAAKPDGGHAAAVTQARSAARVAVRASAAAKCSSTPAFAKASKIAAKERSHGSGNLEWRAALADRTDELIDQSNARAAGSDAARPLVTALTAADYRGGHGGDGGSGSGGGGGGVDRTPHAVASAATATNPAAAAAGLSGGVASKSVAARRRACGLPRLESAQTPTLLVSGTVARTSGGATIGRPGSGGPVALGRHADAGRLCGRPLPQPPQGRPAVVPAEARTAAGAPPSAVPAMAAAAAGVTPPSLALGGAPPSHFLGGVGGAFASAAPPDRPRKPFSGPPWGTWVSDLTVRAEERRAMAGRRLATVLRWTA